MRPLLMALTAICVGCLVALTTTVPAEAEPGPVKVGDHHAVLLQTPHPAPLAPSGQPAWLEVIHHPGASYIAVHFARFILAPGEQVVVRTPDGRFAYTFTGEGKPGANGRFWATHVPGDICEVLLLGGGSERAGWGFVIDEYAAGYPLPKDLSPSAPESICGPDDSEWAKCYESSEPDIYGKSRAVVRLLINGSGACTGWLVGSEGHLLTNNHCISTTASAKNTDYEFMAEGASCSTNCASWLACPGTVVASTATLVKTDLPRDYTLLKLPVNPTPTYGFMQLRPSGAVVGERIYIPGHPAAWGKRFAVRSTASQDTGGYALVYSLTEPGCQSGGPNDVGYFADTQGGSSGSPVLAYSDHRVVALHHCGGCPNLGVPINEVIAHLGDSLPPSAVEDAPWLRVQSDNLNDACAAGSPGHGDGVLDPGETTNLTLQVNNTGNLTATGITANLATASPHLTLTDPSAAFADLTPGASGANLDSLVFSLAPDTPCGAPLSISVKLTADSREWTHTLSYRSGLVTPEATLFLAEGFEGEVFPPAGWSQYKTGNSSSAGFRRGQAGSTGSHGSPRSGSSFAWHDDDDLSTAAIDWLVLPEYMVPAAGAVLKFWERDYYGSYYEYHGVWVTTGPDPSPAVSTYTEHLKLAAPGATWKLTTVDLSAWAGQTIFIALRYTGDYKDEWYLDDFELWDSSCAENSCNPEGMHFLSVSLVGSGSGTVTSNPSGITCGLQCGEFFPEDSEVTLTAAVDPGSTFTGWSGACSGTDPCVVLMDEARSFTASFTLDRHELTVNRTGTGTVTSAPEGIDCGTSCTQLFDHGTPVTLTAQPDAGSTFTGWSGACTGTDPCQMTMDEPRSVTATFAVAQHLLTVNLAGEGSGTVTSDPSGIDCGATCESVFEHGNVVSLFSAAGTDSGFVGWTGACEGNGACTVNMDQARSVTAAFQRLPKALTVARDGNGAGTVTSNPTGISCGTECTVSFGHGQSVELSALATPGSVFAGWAGACTGSGTCTVVMDQNRNVTAAFVQLPDLAPVGVGIDLVAGENADGNGVFEPGETVVFSPIWRNPGTHGKAATGTLSGFAGPAGAIYSIGDANSDYGLIAPGAIADSHGATGDAYVLTVSAPETRPALHWDVQITEALSSGETRTFTLHLGDSFQDVPRSHWAYVFVERLLHGGLTTGCAGDRTYCPADSVSREQMAAFVARGLAGGDGSVPQAGEVPGIGAYDCVPGGTSQFADVPADAWYCRHAHYLWMHNVTTGCDPVNRRYCPSDLVPRDQMAVFVSRAVAGGDVQVPVAYSDPDTGKSFDCTTEEGTFFVDVTHQHWACRHVHYLWARGQVSGCDPVNHLYCPAPSVRRDEMAKFLANGFKLSLGE